MGTTMDSDVRGLVDRAAIYNLLCQYCDALDFRKWRCSRTCSRRP